MPDIFFDPTTAISETESRNGQPVTLRLSEASTREVSVSLSIFGGTALAPQDADFDFSINPRLTGMATFAAGETSVTFFIEQNGDSGDEVDENYIVELTDPINATFPGNVDLLRATGVIEDDGRALFVSDPSILEGDDGQRFAEFEVRVSRISNDPMNFTYQTFDGSALAGEDYDAVSGTISFVPGQTVSVVRVPVTGDTQSEATETLFLSVTPDAATAQLLFNGVDDNVGMAQIRDDDGDARTPVVTLETFDGIENSSPGQPHVLRLSEASTRDVTVTVQISSGTAVVTGDADFDFSINPRQIITVTIPAGETARTFFVEQGGDAGNEFDEYYTLSVTDPVNATLAGGVDVLTESAVIIDDGRIVFVSNASILEGDGAGEVVFEIRLSRPSEDALSFTYETVDQGAEAGEDYTAQAGDITFLPGQTYAYVRVPIAGDTVSENSEAFSLRITPSADSAALLNDVEQSNVGTALLRDDDGEGITPVISVETSNQPEFGEGHPIVVTLSQPSTREVSVTMEVVAGTATVPGDIDFDFSINPRLSTTVEFPAGETSRTVFLESNGDQGDEVDENFIVELTDPVNATLAGGVEVLRATAVLEDDGRSLFVSDPTILEGDGNSGFAEFEIRISRPSTEVLSFDYETRDGTAEAGEDYTATSGSLTFAPGETVSVVRVPIEGDMTSEATEKFFLSVTPDAVSETLLFNGVDDRVGLARIRDDDGEARTPVVSLETRDGLEQSSGHLHLVRLSEASTRDVTVTIQIQSGTADVPDDADFDFSINPRQIITLTVPAGQTTRGFSVEQGGTAGDELDEYYTIAVTDPINATLAGGADVLQETSVIYDDGRSVFAGDITAYEGRDEEAIFEIRLSRPADQTLVFTASTFDTSATNGMDYTSVSETVRFLPGETYAYLRVPLIDDDEIESLETFGLSLRADAATQAFLPVDAVDLVATATIVNDDVPPPIIEGDDGPNLLNGTPGPDTIFGREGNDTIFGFAGFDTINGEGGNDSISAGDGNDLVDGGPGADTINGGFGFDTVDGGEGDDVIRGLNGFDSLSGNGGNDSLQGNFGNDTLNGGDGMDTLEGGLGFDSLIGGADNDFLQARDGFDTLEGGAGDDTLEGNNGNDQLNGGEGNDSLEGGLGADVLAGEEGDDVLLGANGFDRLDGGSGNDTLEGNFGNDTLNGGDGDDLLRGGSGADTFEFASGADTISDFQNNVDALVIDGTLLTETNPDANDLRNYLDPQGVGGDLVFDFGDGNTLTVRGLDNVQQLLDDVSFI